MALSGIMTRSLLAADTSRQIAHVQQSVKNKMDALNYYAPNAEIHDFPDRSHSGIFSDEDLHPFYRELMEKLIGEEGQRR